MLNIFDPPVIVYWAATMLSEPDTVFFAISTNEREERNFRYKKDSSEGPGFEAILTGLIQKGLLRV